ncbi:hypothetical protein J6590_044412 [Homalodisca vitripennis]|nr:hypothetical protein J6590_044412 [Homalodisca vitripennis]
MPNRRHAPDLCEGGDGGGNLRGSTPIILYLHRGRSGTAKFGTTPLVGVPYESKILNNLDLRACHPLPALTEEAGSELASPSYEGT